jgi:serine/threonine protein kinase
MGVCGASGAPFKITCSAYGYTVVGKGTTSRLWNKVLREADVYRVLSQAQGSAVPVFLGAIDLAKIYFLHGAGEIRHMLLMAWGGEPMSKIQYGEAFRQEISRSNEEVRSLGVLHQDLRLDNILWNTELKRALIIDFHRSQLVRRRMKKRMRLPEQLSCGTEAHERKRLRAVYK